MGHGHRPWFTLSILSISHAPRATAGLSKGTTLVWVIEKAFFIFVTQSVQWSLWGSYVCPTFFFFSYFLSLSTFFTYKQFFWGGGFLHSFKSGKSYFCVFHWLYWCCSSVQQNGIGMCCWCCFLSKTCFYFTQTKSQKCSAHLKNRCMR